MIASVRLHLNPQSLVVRSPHFIASATERRHVQTCVVSAQRAEIHSVPDRRLVDVLIRALAALSRRLVCRPVGPALGLALLTNLLLIFLKMLIFELGQRLRLVR